MEKGVKTTYDYDSLNQIKMVVYDEKVTEQFDYDAVGNRIKRTLQGKEENYYYNNKNQLLQIDKENDTIFYKYDNQGNTLEQTSSKGTTTYQYDIYNRTRQVTTENGDTIKNKYDPLGFRYKKEVNGETHKYIFDGWSITAETNKDGELKSREVRGYGFVKKETNNKQYYYHQNEHDDITHLTNTDSEVENSYQYDVFGNIREQQENVENVFKYAGEQLDSETQQYYLRARFYNPVIARFTQEDVYRGDGLNLYVYVVNNPLLWFDPSGYKKCLEGNKKKSNTSSYGIVNGKTPASRFADKVRGLSNSKRPNTVAVVRTSDGKYYIGYNKAGIYNETIQNVLDNLDNSNEYNRQCAEVNALSRALNKGADLNGATISIANVRGKNNKSGVHGTYKAPCDVCGPLLNFYKIKDIH